MKVIFLDFDGVLNSVGSFTKENRRTPEERKLRPTMETLCSVCCSNLQYVVDKNPGVKIVLSTTWRELFDMDWLRSKLQSYGIDSSVVIDKTGTDYRGRGQEIQNWLDKHPEVQDRFVIIDDNDDGISAIFGKSGLHTSNFVQTSWMSGMDMSHALRAIQILDGDYSGYDLPI